MLPLQSADGRVGAHRALEVDVVALLDGLGAQRRAQAQLDDRRICKEKKKGPLKELIGGIKVGKVSEMGT